MFMNKNTYFVIIFIVYTFMRDNVILEEFQRPFGRFKNAPSLKTDSMRKAAVEADDYEMVPKRTGFAINQIRNPQARPTTTVIWW